MTRRISLAWHNLTHRKVRLVVAVLSVAFAALLIAVELGFWYALLDSTTELIDQLDAELIMVHRAKYSITVSMPFARQRLTQAQAVPGVKDALAMYVEVRSALWSNPEETTAGTAHRRPIRVLAFDLDVWPPPLRMGEVQLYAEQLKMPDTVLIDARSRSFFGRRSGALDRELSAKAVHVVGTFNLGTDFANDGNLIMSADNYAELFPLRNPSQSPLAQVEVGLIRLQEGADLEQTLRALQQALGDDTEVEVLTRAEFARREQTFWQTATPVGFVFGLGVAMGFGVGVIVCYQILATDVADHLSEYATLKAIGYSNSYLTRVVLEEALILSVLGFLPGLLLSKVVYELLAAATGLPLELTLLRGTFVLALTVGMCVLSGLIVIRKVQVADPAEVF